MLDDFIRTNREAILAGSRARIASRQSPRPTSLEMSNGIPMFLDQLCDAIELARSTSAEDHEAIKKSASLHGSDLLRMGLTIGQVVHDYGDVCQAIMELALHQGGSPLTGDEFRTLNLCLDDAIAGAVTAYSKDRESTIRDQHTERLGMFAHELRNLLNTVMLAFESIQKGQVAVGGSTGMILARGLTGLRTLIDRSLSEVRLDAGLTHFESIAVADIVGEIEIGASLQATARGVRFSVAAVERLAYIEGDRQTLVATVCNLLQNAFKFTHKDSSVTLTTIVTPERVLFEIEDECGGLPPGKLEELFQPFSQRSPDKSGMGLGLTICHRAAQANGGEISVRDLPGKGCVFTLNLPRKPPPPLTVLGGGKGQTRDSAAGGAVARAS